MRTRRHGVCPLQLPGICLWSGACHSNLAAAISQPARDPIQEFADLIVAEPERASSRGFARGIRRNAPVRKRL